MHKMRINGANTQVRPYTKVIVITAVCAILLSGCASQTNTGWGQADKILSRIKAPQFPAKDFAISDYGAVGDGKTDCTQAINKAITAANKAGGGRVVVPAGTYLTGAIYLKSNVNLYISKDAVVKFSTDPNQYLPAVFTRWEGVECMNYSALIYAYEEKNIAMTGEGTLDGQGSDDNWWKWRRELQTQGQGGIVCAGTGRRAGGEETIRRQISAAKHD